jgi:hypothetical protein
VEKEQDEILTVGKLRDDPEERRKLKAMNAAFFSVDPIGAFATLRNDKAQCNRSVDTGTEAP